MMKKFIKLYIALCVTVLSLTACGAKEEATTTQEVTATTKNEESAVVEEKNNEEIEGAKQEVYTFTDDLGREVTINSADRVACLIGSFADTWLLAGGEVIAAANDAWTSFDLDLGDEVVKLGSIQEPDVEKLIAANPDFVIASSNTKGDLELESILTEAGITVAYFDVSNFDEYLHMLDILTDITGRKDLYEKNGIAVQEKINDVLKRVPEETPSVLFIRTAASSVKAKGSTGTVGGEILAALGCKNIADSDNGLLEDLSMEAIILADPDYIFVTTQGTDTEAALKNIEEQLTSNPAWSSLSAIQKGNYYLLDKSLYNLKPNARWAEAYEKLADILYTEK